MNQTQHEGSDLNLRKEALSYAYIDCIATTAGYECQTKRRVMDNAGIDLTIEVPGEMLACLSPKVDVQVKCTSSDCINGDFIHFNLEVRNYDRLIDTRSIIPLILIVVLVSKNTTDWIKNSANDDISTRLGAGAYWISLKGEQSTDNTNTKTIKIPLSHRLSPEVLQEIMRKIAQREDL